MLHPTPKSMCSTRCAAHDQQFMTMQGRRLEAAQHSINRRRSPKCRFFLHAVPKPLGGTQLRVLAAAAIPILLGANTVLRMLSSPC